MFILTLHQVFQGAIYHSKVISKSIRVPDDNVNHNNVGKNMSGTNGLTKAERPDNIGNVFLLKSSEKHRTEKGNQNPATNFHPIL